MKREDGEGERGGGAERERDRDRQTGRQTDREIGGGGREMEGERGVRVGLSLIHISEPTRPP